jgi:hypothetical protein
MVLVHGHVLQGRVVGQVVQSGVVMAKVVKVVGMAKGEATTIQMAVRAVARVFLMNAALRMSLGWISKEIGIKVRVVAEWWPYRFRVA